MRDGKPPNASNVEARQGQGGAESDKSVGVHVLGVFSFLQFHSMC